MKEAQEAARGYFSKAGIVISPDEEIEVADFGLDDLWNTGLELVTYINTERVCAKELVLTPGQTCPEHYHPKVGDYPGKEETFRCRYGTVYLYVNGEPAKNPATQPPEGTYTVFHEVVLAPGQQHTIYPGTKHWFKAGPKGAIISEFSTRSFDEHDVFTDQRITRIPQVEEEA